MHRFDPSTTNQTPFQSKLISFYLYAFDITFWNVFRFCHNNWHASPCNISLLHSHKINTKSQSMTTCPNYCQHYLAYLVSWWRHQMETFSALLAICAGNSPVSGEFPAQRPVTGSFDVFFDLHPNKRLSKQWWGWWFETPSCPLWRHRNVYSRMQQTCCLISIVIYGRLALQWLRRERNVSFVLGVWDEYEVCN